MPSQPVDDQPLVSCIMPTRDRPQFIQQAAFYFLRQDYPNKQLVVVDDGQRAIGDLLPDDERIKYVRLVRKMPLGAKRNVACEASSGEIIAHFDDDDWMAPDRLSRQVDDLFRSEADATGLRPLRCFRLESGESFLYRKHDDDSWVAPGTLVYRKAAWASRRFADLESGEGEAFAARFEAGRVHALDAPDLYVALLHPGNLTPRDLRSTGYQRTPVDDIARLIQLDREFYVRIRNGSQPMLPRAAKGMASITFTGGFVVYEGYGSMTEYAVLGMARAGAKVDPIPMGMVREGLTGEFLKLLASSQPKADSPVIYYSWPQPDMQRYRGANDLFIYTMVESSRVPPVWVKVLNDARCVIVPTRYMADAFRDSGVTVPVEVVHQGVDPAIYHYEDRPDDRGLTTIIVAAVEERKHTKEGIEAWKIAFAGDPDARLIIKARFQYGNYEPDDPRITFVDENTTTRGIAHWYRQADVLMALGNEGFGLPLVEGMATGLPAIALDSEGQSDTCSDAKGLLLSVPPQGYYRHVEPQRGDFGVRAYPGIAAIADHLVWIKTHRDEARAMGRAASEWAIKHRNIWDHGPGLLGVLERHMSRRRPLRRRPHLWVPTWETACGVSEFTRDLQAHLPEVAAGANAPDPETARLVHLQQENGMSEHEASITAGLARLRQRGVRIAVTEHSVMPGVHAWERDADVLVSTTAAGTDELRKKWPGKRVEHIPLGCHTFFPPRKARRGKVIGTFGFSAAYKGVSRLIDLQRETPGSTLLIYSHNRMDPSNHPLAEQADGDSVRLVTDFLSPEEVAARLAAEADVLIFWYEPVPYHGSSGAARMGLATGVPVMTSPIRFFEDLKEVTFQPADPLEGLRRLLEDDYLRERLVGAAMDYCRQNSWERIAQRHRALWDSLQIA